MPSSISRGPGYSDICLGRPHRLVSIYLLQTPFSLVAIRPSCHAPISRSGSFSQNALVVLPGPLARCRDAIRSSPKEPGRVPRLDFLAHTPPWEETRG